jgi:hypothetical protein
MQDLELRPPRFERYLRDPKRTHHDKTFLVTAETALIRGMRRLRRASRGPVRARVEAFENPSPS